jgi:pimeloyl-ACP methyl ester carboxylesterase
MNYYVKKVTTLINHLKIEKFSVVGHSMGGYVALLLKEQIIGCEKVVLLNSNFWSDSEQKKKDRVRMADIAFKAKKILIQESIPNLFGNPVGFSNEIEKLKIDASQMTSEAIAYASLSMRERIDFSDQLRSNPHDYYVIHGINDRLVQTEELNLKMPNTKQLFFIQNAGHMAHIENPKRVIQIFKRIFT